MSPRKLLLIDGIGATVSAIFLAVILVMLKKWIGMPVETLYLLALFPGIFLIYDFLAVVGVITDNHSGHRSDRW